MDKKFKEWFLEKRMETGLFLERHEQIIHEAYLLGKESRKKSKGADECYPEFVRLWTEAYPILQFDAVSGKKIKSLIRKTKAHVIGKGKEPEKDMVCNMFAYVIAYAKREHHFCDGQPITTWDSHYLSIINEISNGKKQPVSKIRSGLDDLRSRTRNS